MKTALLSLLLVVSQLPLIADDKSDYVAHEWGTFTSVQGADGVQLEWNPFVAPELPKFVYDRKKPSGDPRLAFTNPFSKSYLRTLQRMETPVIYFYSDKARTVDVQVKFPKGLVTEWYPQAQDIGPSYIKPNPILAQADAAVNRTGLQMGISLSSLNAKATPESLIHWGKIEIVPTGPEAKNLDLPLRDHVSSHYYAARETDANLLHVPALLPNGSSTTENEKFLFYRGVGYFKAPLEVTIKPNQESYLHLKNNGAMKLTHLYVLNVHDGQGKFIYVNELAAGEEKIVSLEPQNETLPAPQLADRIGEAMVQSLTKEGLYPREAAAMVKTWHDSWFEERGMRVLYTLPHEWTDTILPLAITPSPKEVKRVFVGRAEVIAPSRIEELKQELTSYRAASGRAQQEIVHRVWESGPGRFLEPSMNLALAKTEDIQYRNSGWQLVSEVMKYVDQQNVAHR